MSYQILTTGSIYVIENVLEPEYRQHWPAAVLSSRIRILSISKLQGRLMCWIQTQYTIIWQGLSIRENICAKASRKIWCLTRLLEGQRVPYKGVADPLGPPPQTPLSPSKIHLNPPKTIMDPRYHQYNPSSYHITHKILPISTEAPKMQKVSKKGRKCPKIKKSANCNNENWPIHIPCDIYFHFWWPK